MVSKLHSVKTIFLYCIFQTITNNKFNFSFLEEEDRIFNCDETGMSFDVISKYVCAERGVRYVPGNCRGIHERVSVLSCVNATGSSVIPNLFVFTSSSGKVPQHVQDGAEVNAMFAGQKSGWMTKDIYLDWFKSHFLKRCPKHRPLLLIFDGLKSYVTLELIECAEENSVLLFCLPVHSSHQKNWYISI